MEAVWAKDAQGRWVRTKAVLSPGEPASLLHP